MINYDRASLPIVTTADSFGADWWLFNRHWASYVEGPKILPPDARSIARPAAFARSFMFSADFLLKRIKNHTPTFKGSLVCLRARDRSPEKTARVVIDAPVRRLV